jgi:hypothetical protein
MDLFENNYPSNGHLNKTLNNKINPNNIENVTIYKNSSNFSYDMVKYLLKIFKFCIVVVYIYMI